MQHQQVISFNAVYMMLWLIGATMMMTLGVHSAPLLSDRNEAQHDQFKQLKLLIVPFVMDKTTTTTTHNNQQLTSSPSPPSQSPSSQPSSLPSTTSQYPWPYPPSFEPVLPQWAKEQLITIYMDTTLTSDQRVQRINDVFDSLSLDILTQLPLPHGYERLPADVYRRILYVHTAPMFKWSEREQLIQQIVAALPQEQRDLMKTRLSGPPPGFEYVLAPTIYKQLLIVHYNTALTKQQKADHITLIMRQVPQEQIERLPLPAGMERLPMEHQQRLRALVYDYTVPQRVRNQRVLDYVAQQVPEHIRPSMTRR